VSGSLKQTFQNYLIFPSSMVKVSKKEEDSLTLEDGSNE
jgi:hypothetical protein